MTGHGTSYGAISVLNAIPCGIGSTIGIDLRTDVTFEPHDGPVDIRLIDRPGLDDRLVRTCVRRTLERIGEPADIGYSLTCRTDIPPSRGLKSSSSVCNATICAVLDHFEKDMDDVDIVRLGVECAIECKVTITGAFDDACGCHLNGLVVTDNGRRELLSRGVLPRYDVLIYSPREMITKDRVDVSKYRAMADLYNELAHRIREDPLGVLTDNGRAVAGIIGMSNDLAEDALRKGALAAGVSGTGPAVAIVCEPGDGDRMQKELNIDAMRCHVR